MILDEEGSSPLLETFFLCYSSCPAPCSAAGAAAESGSRGEGCRDASAGVCPPAAVVAFLRGTTPVWGDLSCVSVIPASGCASVGLFLDGFFFLMLYLHCRNCAGSMPSFTSRVNICISILCRLPCTASVYSSDHNVLSGNT